MFRQRQPLALIGRADLAAVELVRSRDQALVDEAAEDLAVLDQERDLVGAHFENSPAPRTTALGGTKARIEETGEMDAEFADKGVVGQHFGRVIGRYDDRLARSENVEIVWVEDDPARAAGPAVGVDRLPEVARIVLIDPVDIDQIGVAARLVAANAAPGVAGDIDGAGEAIADCLA